MDNGWALSYINQDYQMTRTERQYIVCRDLTWWEKILYFRKRRRGF